MIVKEIDNKKDYKDFFKEKSSFKNENLKENEKKLHECFEHALNQSLEVRKFEIELYWKRATYFWAFIATSFAGYFAVLNSSNIDKHRSLTILIAFVGFFFSLCWYLVNRGSKYWQQNWEDHVYMLENEFLGPLFKTIRNPKQHTFWNLVEEYPISVSKVNQILSLFIVLIWIFILVYSTVYTFTVSDNDNNECIWAYVILLVLIAIFTIALLVVFAPNTTSKKYKKKKKHVGKNENDSNRKFISFGDDE